MSFRDLNARADRHVRAFRAAERHMRWRHICLEAIEDHRDLEGFAPIPGLTEIDTAITAAAGMKGSVEHGLLRRAAYHELMLIYALRKAGAGTRDRALMAELREFLGLGRDATGVAASEIDDRLVLEVSSVDDDQPPGRHPPPSSGRPRARRLIRTRRTGSRRGHGSSCPPAAAMAPPAAH